MFIIHPNSTHSFIHPYIYPPIHPYFYHHHHPLPPTPPPPPLPMMSNSILPPIHNPPNKTCMCPPQVTPKPFCLQLPHPSLPRLLGVHNHKCSVHYTELAAFGPCDACVETDLPQMAYFCTRECYLLNWEKHVQWNHPHYVPGARYSFLCRSTSGRRRSKHGTRNY